MLPWMLMCLLFLQEKQEERSREEAGKEQGNCSSKRVEVGVTVKADNRTLSSCVERSSSHQMQLQSTRLLTEQAKKRNRFTTRDFLDVRLEEIHCSWMCSTQDSGISIILIPRKNNQETGKDSLPKETQEIQAEYFAHTSIGELRVRRTASLPLLSRQSIEGIM